MWVGMSWIGILSRLDMRAWLNSRVICTRFWSHTSTLGEYNRYIHTRHKPGNVPREAKTW